MLGKLSWAAVPLDQPIPLVAGCVAFGIVGGIAVYVVLKGWAPYLWREWITSVDHKHIGVMYIFLAMVMLLRGLEGSGRLTPSLAAVARQPLLGVACAVSIDQYTCITEKRYAVLTGSVPAGEPGTPLNA
jgi:hypothetical protein